MSASVPTTGDSDRRARRARPPVGPRQCTRSPWPSGGQLDPRVERVLFALAANPGSPFRNGPIRTLADLEEITSAWVHWYNTERLMHRLGRRPPAEAEAGY